MGVRGRWRGHRGVAGRGAAPVTLAGRAARSGARRRGVLRAARGSAGAARAEAGFAPSDFLNQRGGAGVPPTPSSSFKGRHRFPKETRPTRQSTVLLPCTPSCLPRAHHKSRQPPAPPRTLFLFPSHPPLVCFCLRSGDSLSPQTNRIAMSTWVAPRCACMFVTDLRIGFLRSCPLTPHLAYLRYIHDTFIIWT